MNVSQPLVLKSLAYLPRGLGLARLCNLGLFLVASLATADVIVVDDFNDAVVGSMSECQLRDAIASANLDGPVNGCTAGNGADVIEFAGPGGNFIVLVENLPQITDDLEINGPGTELLVLDGDDQYSMFFFGSGVIGAVRSMTLFQGERALGGACLESFGAQNVVVEDVIVEACRASGSSSGAAKFSRVLNLELRRVSFVGNIGSTSSGLLILGGSVTAEDVLFFGNTSSSNNGALIIGSSSGGATVTLRRCTFFDNVATGSAAIAVVSSDSSLVLEHCTILGNRATFPASSGAIRNAGSLTLFNTIVADNLRAVASAVNADIDNGGSATLTSLGHNLLGNNDGVATEFPVGLPNANLDLVGTSVALARPDLGPLLDNGGPQMTMIPNAASPVIDQGSCPGELVDQRGYHNEATGMRPVDDVGFSDSDDGCDIGAVERGAMEPPLFSDGFETGDATSWS